nr:ATP-binding cassette domain-containing protein [Armatimonadota bacterium]NIO95860.1 ATP-binding cassette domain-containing protein [Armatimonadota bacterium]
MMFIEVKEVFKEYPTATALRGVDMAMEKGRWCSIMGASGSGKSTLLNII